MADHIIAVPHIAEATQILGSISFIPSLFYIAPIYNQQPGS
jgi:hypothetical protein